MIISNKYAYPTLERVDSPTGRHYVSPLSKMPLPSVTTILSKTKDDAYLKEWQERVGMEEAERARKEGAALGEIVHKYIEEYIEDKGFTEYKKNMLSILATKMAKKIISEAFPDITEIFGYEKALYVEGLYAGTTDLLGLFQKKETVLDYKNTKSMKDEEHITDYFCQGAAYCVAHNEMFNTNIKRIAILMVDRQLVYKTFLIEGNDFDKYHDMWLYKLDDFYSNHYKQ